MLESQKRLSNSFFALLSLPATAMGFALSVQISALSWILSTKFGLDIHEVGIVWAAGPAAGIIGQVVIGMISDKVWFWNGRRRPFILIGGVAAALSLLALPNIGVINDFLGLGNIMVVAIMVALTLDLAVNISFNPTRSIIADVTPEGDTRTKGYTWMQTVSGFFGVLAYVIGASFDNYVLIYVGVGLVFVFSLVPTLFIAEPRQIEDSKSSGEANGHGTNLTEFVKICLAHAFCWLGIQTMFVYIFAYIKGNLSPISDNEIGVVIAVSFAVLNTVGFLLPAPVLQPLAKKIGTVKVHTISMAIMALGYGLITFFAMSPFVLYSFMAIVGIGWAATVSLPFAIMSQNVEQSKMGLYMGLFNLSVVIPQLVVSFGFGNIIQNAANKNMVFVLSTITLSISAILWLFVKENTHK